MLVSSPRAETQSVLHELVRQCERSGAKRNAVLLHTDRLPSHLARPHHTRMARQTLLALLDVDRAQFFDLPHGRVAVTWRNGGRVELNQVRAALLQLVGEDITVDLDDLLTLYELPDQAIWLLDQIAEGPKPTPKPLAKRELLNLNLLARLEAGLAQADLSHFVRRRPVMTWSANTDSLAAEAATDAWEDRFFALDELSESLCPERDIGGDPWLYRRLTRTLDRRMLAALSSQRDFAKSQTYALDMNVVSILSSEFLRFDQTLPLKSRGQVILNLNLSDVMSDPSSFTFARSFAQARQYRLALAETTWQTLELIDVAAMGLDVIRVAVCPDLRANLSAFRRVAPQGVIVVLTGLKRPSELRWAKNHGFTYGQGAVFGS